MAKKKKVVKKKVILPKKKKLKKKRYPIIGVKTPKAKKGGQLEFPTDDTVETESKGGLDSDPPEIEDDEFDDKGYF